MMLEKNKTVILYIGLALGALCLSTYNFIQLQTLSSKHDNVLLTKDELLAVFSNPENIKTFKLLARENAQIRNAIIGTRASDKRVSSSIRPVTAPPNNSALAQYLKTNNAIIFNNKNDPVLGNPNGSKVLVEFIDYNCGYCKRMSKVLTAMTEQDSDLKIVVKEFPIFTSQPSSRYAALMGLSVNFINPEKYAEYHQAILATASLSISKIDTIVKDLGITKTELAAVTDKANTQLQNTLGVARTLRIRGTPAFIYGDQVKQGGMTFDKLKALLETNG